MSRDLAAYGIAFAALGGRDSPEPPPSWPRWTVTQEVGPADDSPGIDVWADRARISIPTVGMFALDRVTQQIVMHIRQPWSPELVLHPGLAPAASLVAHWMGRATLHAAAVLINGRVWGLLGEKGAGKSTMATHLVGLGCGLLTDDLLVVDGMEGFAGPAALDLRGGVGSELGARPLGVIGTRERWRAAMRVETLSAPIGGWVQLGWSDRATTRDLGPADRLQVLNRSTMLPPQGTHLLRLADVPLFRLSRRYSAGDARADAANLLGTIAGCAAPCG